MGRVEAAIFASASPVPRDALARLVGATCNLNDLLDDIAAELRHRPYDLVTVAGGYQLRTKPRYAGAIRALRDDSADAGAVELNAAELFALAAIAYRQPLTRAELSRLAGKEVSRDLIARLKRRDLVAAGPRAPEPGAPYAFITTRNFLIAFGLGSLADLPDLDQLADAGLLETVDLDAALGLGEDDQGFEDE
jgi:segregation and condensation protein B